MRRVRERLLKSAMRRTDLLKAVAARFVEVLRDEVPAFFAENIDAAMEKQATAFVRALVKNRKGTRDIVGLLATSEDDEGLKKQLADDVEASRKITARMMRREVGDPDVDLTLACLWGLALMHLVLDGRRSDATTDAVLDRLYEYRSASVPAKSARTSTGTEPAARKPKRAQR